jgi:hypothetical protein
MTTLTPTPSEYMIGRAFTFAERHNAEAYRCAWCKRIITDGAGTVAILHVGGEEIEIDGLCCCEAHAEANARLTPILEGRFK